MISRCSALLVISVAACSFEPAHLDVVTAPGDTNPGSECGTVAIYSDSFDDGVMAPGWGYHHYEYNGATHAEVDGRLEITAPSGSPPEAYAGYYSTYAAALGNERMEVELVSVSGSGVSLQAFFSFHHDAGNSLGFMLTNGQLRARWMSDGSLRKFYDVAFDPEQHRYWGLQQRRGEVFFLVSSDRLTWNPLGAVPSPDYLDNASVQVGAGTWATELETHVVRFDNLIPTSRATVGWCPIGQLHDDFEDGVIDTAWRIWSSADGSVEERDGRLSLSVQSGELVYAESQRAWDLRGGELSVRVIERPTTTGTLSGLTLVYEGRAVSSFAFQGSRLIASWTSEDRNGAVPADDIGYQWLRVRENRGDLYFAASVDGVDWDPIFTMAGVGAYTNAMGVRLSLDARGATGTPSVETATYDELNIRP